MKWFDGGISSAISASKEQKAMFVVFVECDAAKGQEMAKLWDAVDVEDFSCPVVALRFTDSSSEAKQFSAIYPTPFLPVSYFLDLNGRPIEVITPSSDLSTDSFRRSLEKSCNVFLVGGAISDPSQSHSGSTSSEELAAKVKRAKELFEMKKAEEAKKKLKEEQQKELERREASKQLGDLREEMRKKQMIEAAEERRKQKVEAQREMERLREQIKADRAERESRRIGQVAARPPTSSSSSLPQPPPVFSDRCRIQVRFPDGSTTLHDLPSTDVLASLKSLIAPDPQLSGSSFRLAQPAPRHIFEASEYEKSFVDLRLTPSSTLLVLPDASKLSSITSKGSQLVSQQSLSLSSLFSLFSFVLWTPINFILNFVGYKTAKQDKKDEEKSTAQSSVVGPSGDGNRRGARRAVPRGATVVQRGNIRGLHNDEREEEPTDDEGNWNGNSTQFL